MKPEGFLYCLSLRSQAFFISIFKGGYQNDTNRKIKKVLQAEEQFKRAQANLDKAKREEKAKLRKEQDRHKFMMGGCVVKYFPEAYDFSEQEMSRIIACVCSLNDVM